MAYLYVILSFLSLSLWAQTPVLRSRASDIDGFPASAMCFFSNNEMGIHQAELVLHFTCVGEDLHDELWIGSRQLIHSSSGRLFNTAISDGTHVFVTEYDEFSTRVLWKIENEKTTAFELPAAWGDVQIHSVVSRGHDHILFTMTDSQGLNVQGEWCSGEWRINTSRGVSYFFDAAASDQLITQKVRLGAPREWSEERPDAIEISLAPNFIPQIVVRDQQSDPQSPYLGFYNFTVVNASRWAVFAKTERGPVAIVGYRLNWREIPLYSFFSSVDFWPPAITESGKFVLRAKHNDGTYGLWIFENEQPRLLLKAGDQVHTDRGLGQMSDTLFYNAPMAFRESVFIGVGLEQNASRESLGQGIIEFSLR